ncbi:MAG: O-antigen ligase family protein [Candidatus Hydrothermia bacterium]
MGFSIKNSNERIFLVFYSLAQFVVILLCILLGDLKLGLKLGLLLFFLNAGILFLNNPKILFLFYVLTIPMASGLVVLSPFYTRFSGLYLEVPNVFAIYNALARPEGIYIYNLMEILLLLSLFLYAFKRDYKLKFHNLLIFSLFFCFASSLSIITALNPVRAVFQNIHLFLSLIMFIFALQVWNGDERYEKLVLFVMVFLILVTVIDVVNLKALKMLMRGTLLVRATGRFNTPNPPAFLAGMGVLFAFYLGLKSKFPLNFLSYTLIFVFMLVILCTGSRNGLISTFVSLFFFLFLLNFSHKKSKNYFIPFFLVIIVIVLYRLGRGLIQLRLNPKLLAYDTSVFSRLLMWRNSISYILRHPFEPVGTGCFFYFNGSLGMPFAHNFLINTLIESGIVPFIMLLAAYITALMKIVRKVFQVTRGANINLEEIVGLTFILYIISVFTFDQFLYDGSLWRFMVVFLSFSISKLWKEDSA